MSQAVLNMVAKKALKNAAVQNINSKDPYFEDVQVLDKRGNPTGKVKKQRKGIPVGVSAHDGKILKSVRKRAYRFDRAISLCGFRLGWSSVVGLVPVVGDVLDCLMAFFFVYRKAAQIEGGLPPALQSRMLLNIVIDFGVGLVPFLGDIADALFKANSRNAWLLEEYLVKKAQTEQAGAMQDPGKAEVVLDRPSPAKTRDGHGHGDVEMGIVDNTPRR
ncbi:unnamed protein product [Discula destructiva]